MWSERNWKPTKVERVIETIRTSTRPAKVQTDCGIAFLKGMGNPAGNDALACELVAGELAQLIGLKVPDFAVVNLDLNISMDGLGSMTCGPAFVSRALTGSTGDDADTFLKKLARPSDIARLVLLTLGSEMRIAGLQTRDSSLMPITTTYFLAQRDENLTLSCWITLTAL